MCDDLEVTLDGTRVREVKGVCSVVHPTLLEQLAGLREQESKRSVAYRPPLPACITTDPNVTQSPLPTDSPETEAINRIASWLSCAKRPVFCKLQYATCEAQRLCIELADLCGGVIDHGESQACVRAMQQVGQCTCSLGEVANRADLVIFWDCDPATTHPRHLDRYSLFAKGDLVPRGREDRYCAVVTPHPGKNQTAQHADLVLSYPSSSVTNVLADLRAAVRGLDASTEAAANETVLRLAKKLIEASYAVVFFGGQFLQDQAACEVLFNLVREVNRYTRMSCLPLTETNGNAAGMQNVIAWSTGFPGAVDFSRRVPQYLQSASSGGSTRGADVTLELSRDSLTVSKLTSQGVSEGCEQIVFPLATFGLSVAGTVVRDDDIALPLRAIVPSRFPSAAELLQQIVQQVRNHQLP